MGGFHIQKKIIVLFTVLVVAFILCGAASAATVKSNQVSKINVGTPTVEQAHADIYRTRVVYEQYDPKTHKYSVWLKNMANGYKGKIMSSSQNQYDPKISGTRVVWWQEDSSGHSSIYCKNVLTGNTVKVQVSTANQCDPDISGGLIVWREINGVISRIHYKNIFTGENGLVSYSTQSQINPAISGSRVVWIQTKTPSSGVYAIYVKNIETGKKGLVLESPQSQFEPAISGTRIIWSSLDGSCHWVVYYKNLASGSTFVVQSAPGAHQEFPSIDGALITWTQTDSSGHRFIGYRNIATGKHGKALTSIYNQDDPSVSASRIVWTQNETPYPSIFIKSLLTGHAGRLTT